MHENARTRRMQHARDWAPTRRAPPVIRITWSSSGVLDTVRHARSTIPDCGAACTARGARAMTPATEPGRSARTSSGCASESPRKSKLRAVGSASTATWSSRSMRRGSVTTAPGRTSSDPAATSPRRRRVSRLFGGCVARQCAEIIGALGGGTHPRDRRGQRPFGGRCAVAARCARLCSRTLPACWRSARICASGSAARIADRRAASRAARGVAGRAARRCVRRRRARQRGARCAAGDALSLAPRQGMRGTGCHARGVAAQVGVAGRRARCSRCGMRSLGASGRRMGGGLYLGVLPTTQRVDRSGHGVASRGLALWIDYGLPRRHYYFPERRDGTLICHFRQRAICDPFLRRDSWTSPRGWISRASRKRAPLAATPSPDTRRRRISSPDLGSTGNAPSRRRRSESASRGSRTKRAHSCCPERWASDSRPWPGCAVWMSPLPGIPVQDLRHTLVAARPAGGVWSELLAHRVYRREAPPVQLLGDLRSGRVASPRRSA